MTALSFLPSAAAGRALSLKAAEVYRKAGLGGIKLFAKRKTVIKLTPAQQAAFVTTAAGVQTAILADLKGKGIDGAAILAKMKASK